MKTPEGKQHKLCVAPIVNGPECNLLRNDQDLGLADLLCHRLPKMRSVSHLRKKKSQHHCVVHT